MKDIFKNFLFSKHILVNESGEDKDAASVILTLAKLFNIKVVKGGELASTGHIHFVAEKLGRNIPESFYKGFPKSVLKLSFEKLAWTSYITILTLMDVVILTSLVILFLKRLLTGWH